MKKLALFMLLSVAVPLFAVISDAEYAKEVQNYKDRMLKYQIETFGGDNERARAEYNRVLPFVLGSDLEALSLFAGEGNLPAVKYLIEVKKVDPNQVTGNYSPLAAAANNGNVEVVKYLLDHGANKDLILDQWGSKAATHASERPEVLETFEYFTPKAKL